MARYFNTTGPCMEEIHYMLPPEQRLPDLQALIERRQYFVVHAPRQTGKTTAMLALAARLRAEGMAALWCTFETCQGMTETAAAEPLWLQALDEWGRQWLPDPWKPPAHQAFQQGPSGGRLKHYLETWCGSLDVPVVLLIDETDVVTGPALVSLLRQLRAGFMGRMSGTFPSSVALVGMRDLRDYLTEAKDGAPVNPGSPFNVKAASLTLRNFTPEEIASLLAQHTDETGQPFTDAALDRICWWTRGQPYLVNALADHCVSSLQPDRSQPVCDAHVDQAKEALILARTTHLDSLAQRLQDPRVAGIVQTVLLGDAPLQIPYDSDDFDYVVDLGLIRRGPDGAEPANPIYREVLARQLTYRVQSALPRPWWPWSTDDGRLDFPALVEAFRRWWRENSDVLTEQAPCYPEAVPHLAFMAFLQRVVNGGGQVHREFAAGRGAIDLLIEYGPDRFVVELKRVRPRDSLETQRDRGVAQTARYLETVGEAEGWLLLFDVRPGRSWDQRLFAEDVDVGDKRVRVRGA